MAEGLHNVVKSTERNAFVQAKRATLNFLIGIDYQQSPQLDTTSKQAMEKFNPRKNFDIVSYCVFVLLNFAFVCGMTTSSRMLLDDKAETEVSCVFVTNQAK